MEIHKQSMFSRSLANEEKLGAYYTDIEMCRRIKNLFSFPETKECCVIEPSIGNGRAVSIVTGKEGGFYENVKVFGIELNPKTYTDEVKDNPVVDYSLQADFLNGVIISNNAFPFCFMNPPYGQDGSGERLEYLFMQKVAQYIRPNGYLCMVIPSYVFTSGRFVRQYLARFHHVAHYRFDDPVYAQFKQIVVVGKKKISAYVNDETYLEFLDSVYDIQTYPYLPRERVESPISIPVGESDKVSEFTTREFDADAVGRLLREHSPIYSSVTVGKKTEIESFAAVELGEPILPPSPSMCYLMATVGGGAGLCGDEGTLHLQRGIAEVVKENHEEAREDGSCVVVETTRTKMSLKILENDGTITSF